VAGAAVWAPFTAPTGMALAGLEKGRSATSLVSMVRHIRFHGRGGEGVKLASRIVSRAAFFAGSVVQDSPLYGAERRGAPVVAFTRVSDQPILERGYIDAPDAVVVIDASLLTHPGAAVPQGLDTHSLLLVNSTHTADDLCAQHQIAGRVVTLDVSSIALELLGQHILSAPIAGFVAKATGVAAWDVLDQAVRLELGEIGLSVALIERNVEATRRAFDASPAPGFLDRLVVEAPLPEPPFTLPRFPARFAAPSIDVAATSALRTTEGWRLFRPEIELERCTRCFICFVLCPEGAIELDAQHYPVIDYAHCKGCLVCVAECPPQVITAVREAAA
jgi:pyruvate ferredoxin oxidoreductase gamma subunit